MKKILSLVVLSCITFAAVAAPWDTKPSEKNKTNWVTPHFEVKALASDPFITNSSITEESFPRRIHIWIQMNAYTTVKLRILTMVYGYWANVNEWGPKFFDVPINVGQNQGTYDHILQSGDIALVDTYDFMGIEPW